MTEADLESEGLVKNGEALQWLARYRGQENALKAGEYPLSPSLPAEEVLRRITSGVAATYEVSIPEGFTAVMIGERLAARGLADAADFAAVVADPAIPAEFGVEGPTLEGYLFPETYRLPKGLPAKEVARVMVDHFLAVWSELAPAAAEQGLSMREVVTLASVVEKETGAPQERPLISSVFHNRLAKRMRLESDPTTIYGIENFDGNLRRVHLEDETNPYNTYRIKGLPPGAIANPGREALQATVAPAESKFLYFVSRNDGTHKFSATYREHVAAVDAYQRRRRRR